MAGMRIGVLGGTFDPIHVGHLILAEAARQELSLARVLFVPAREPWRKIGRELAPAHHRLGMVRLAIADNPCFSVSTVELEQPGPSYTADTLAALQEEMGPEGELFFILGQDALADLPYWKDPQRIIAQACLAVAQRSGWPLPSEAWLEEAVPGIAARLVPSPMPTIDISASAIRRRCREGRSIRYLVPSAVEEYIQAHGLYTAA
ncbi:MAG: nicotinate-nucleotide adenylyltransferase [Dehalococcoidia bacterium]